EDEPDNISDNLTYGPRIFLSLDKMRETGLVQLGSLIRWRYALKIANGRASDEQLAQFRDQLEAALPEHGFSVRDRRDASPRISRSIERLREFLTLLGLTALLVGGVGVANAVATFIDRRRNVI